LLYKNYIGNEIAAPNLGINHLLLSFIKTAHIPVGYF